MHLCVIFTASVSRIAKYLHTDGTIVLTTGGYSFDFIKPKQDCHDEYYMLIRAGLLSFKTIADFMIEIMHQ